MQNLFEFIQDIEIKDKDAHYIPLEGNKWIRITNAGTTREGLPKLTIAFGEGVQQVLSMKAVPQQK